MPTPNSYGILSFDDIRGIRCVHIGIFNENLRLNSLGQIKKGESEDIIGKFADGEIDSQNHFILAKDYSVKEHDDQENNVLKIENDKYGR